MSTTSHQRKSSETRTGGAFGESQPSQDAEVVAPKTVGPAAGGWLAVTRIALGLTFLWAFLDKTFGLGWSTPSDRSWLSGGSPTNGFLSHVEVGPLTDLFQGLAGKPVVDWLFMIGLLAIGLAFTLGIAMWVSAVSGTLMLMMMWAAEWPPARLTVAGEPSGSTNPFIDYHLIYALAMLTLAVLGAGRVLGLSRQWRGTALGRVLP